MEFTNLTTAQISEIQRAAKISVDFNDKKTFIRQTIFEVVYGIHYVLIEKHKGEIVKIVQAQNPLTLLFKQIN